MAKPILPRLFRSVILRRGLRYYAAERGGVALDLAFVFVRVERVERVVARGVRALTRRFSAVPCGSVEGGGHGVVYAVVFLTLHSTSTPLVA